MFPFHFKAQFNRFPNALQELWNGASVRVASLQIGNLCNIGARREKILTSWNSQPRKADFPTLAMIRKSLKQNVSLGLLKFRVFVH